MGFEVYYHFNEKVDGNYEKGDPRTFKKRVGDPFEEVPIEKLASSITAQLARRDILISDVEIYELSKKKISFKETKGGIVIKNKKFLFDSAEEALSCVSYDEDSSLSDSPPPTATDTAASTAKPAQPHEGLRSRRVIDQVVFSPEPHQLNEINSKPFRLTVDKKYGVLEKRPALNGIGESYLLIDDRNIEQWVSDLYFVPAVVNLLGDKELGFSSTQSEDCKLSWGNSTDSAMPNIRRR